MKYLMLFLALSAPSFAFAGPQCSESNAGEVSCMATRLCECKHFNGSLMKGTPEGYRWDCGILRPSCDAAPKKDAEAHKTYDGPSSVSIDNSSVNVGN